MTIETQDQSKFAEGIGVLRREREWALERAVSFEKHAAGMYEQARHSDAEAMKHRQQAEHCAQAIEALEAAGG